MEKTIQTLKLDNRELIEELKEIHEKNADIYRILRGVREWQTIKNIII